MDAVGVEPTVVFGDFCSNLCSHHGKAHIDISADNQPVSHESVDACRACLYAPDESFSPDWRTCYRVCSRFRDESGIHQRSLQCFPTTPSDGYTHSVLGDAFQGNSLAASCSSSCCSLPRRLPRIYTIVKSSFNQFGYTSRSTQRRVLDFIHHHVVGDVRRIPPRQVQEHRPIHDRRPHWGNCALSTKHRRTVGSGSGSPSVKMGAFAPASCLGLCLAYLLPRKASQAGEPARE